MSNESSAQADSVKSMANGCSVSDMKVEKDSIYRTPFDPFGYFQVVSVSKGSAFGFYVRDHPKGYKAGQVGRYPVKELTGRKCNGPWNRGLPDDDDTLKWDVYYSPGGSIWHRELDILS